MYDRHPIDIETTPCVAGLSLLLCFPTFTIALLEIQMMVLDDKLFIIYLNNQKSYIFPNQNQDEKCVHVFLTYIWVVLSSGYVWEKLLKISSGRNMYKALYVSLLFQKMFGLGLFIFIIKFYFNACVFIYCIYSSIIFQWKMFNFYLWTKTPLVDQKL